MELELMCTSAVIRPSQSPYCSPIVLVKENNGGIFCVGYWHLNENTKTNTFPVPHVEDVQDCLLSTMLFNSLDFMSGY